MGCDCEAIKDKIREIDRIIEDTDDGKSQPNAICTKETSDDGTVVERCCYGSFCTSSNLGECSDMQEDDYDI